MSDVVGTREIDLRISIRRDGHRRQNQVDGSVFEEWDAVVRDRFDELGLDAQLVRDDLPELHVEALHLIRFGILEAERRERRTSRRS